MENKSGKIIAIVALAVAVVALSVGFAAFADSLNITGNAIANQSTTNVFDAGTDQANGLRYTGTPSCVYQGGSTSAGDAGTFTNGNDSWTGISVNLAEEGSTVVCTATVTNSSSYSATLTGIETSGPLTITSSGANAATNVTNVTAATTVTISVDDGTHPASTATVGASAATTPASGTVVAANGGTATVTVT